MRSNLPISNAEIELGDDATLVSYTDAEGTILRVNREFTRVSGFRAARVGEQGRGFAVVASEVRSHAHPVPTPGRRSAHA